MIRARARCLLGKLVYFMERFYCLLMATSWDVALAVQSIFTFCNVDGLVAGNQAANGNGTLVVDVFNSNLVVVL